MKVYLYAILILLLMILAVGWVFVDNFKDFYDGFSKVENKSLRIVFSIIAAAIMLILLALPYFLV
ncbi:hypothetical protein [Faecalimicrobium sp. JNUCC 81]